MVSLSRTAKAAAALLILYGLAGVVLVSIAIYKLQFEELHYGGEGGWLSALIFGGLSLVALFAIPLLWAGVLWFRTGNLPGFGKAFSIGHLLIWGGLYLYVMGVDLTPLGHLAFLVLIAIPSFVLIVHNSRPKVEVP